jgi:hypothetical protein
MPKSDLKDRLAVIERLSQGYRFERAVHLVVTSTSFVVLIVCAIALALRDQSKIIEIVGLFTSSGGILTCAGRMLRMWEQSLRALVGQELAGGDS